MKKIVLVLLLLTTTAARAADVDVVRQNFVDYYTAAGADRESPRMRVALEALEGTVRSVTAPGYLLSDGTWTDVDYKEIPDGGWSPWEHVKRLTKMAQAYRTPGQPLYGDAQLRGQIEAGLRQVQQFYGKALPLGNWWFWTLGVPLDLGPTLVLMRGDIPASLESDLVAALRLRIGTSPTSKGLVGPLPTGQNLVWSAHTHLALALLTNDSARLAAIRDAMASVTLTSFAEGIKADGSFHQHGAQLYTGGYGAAFGDSVARYALFARGTAFALPPASLASFADYVADGIAWALYGNFFDVSTVGREVARPTTTGYHGVAALVQAALFESPRAPEIRRAAAQMLQSWQWTFPSELAGLATRVETSGYPAAWPSGYRHYFQSDYTVHRRPGWFASVKMFSVRTKSGERTNGENIRGARQSDGRFFLSLNGTEHFGRDVWPALDWSRLPGITVEQTATAANDLYGYGTSTFAGGAGDGRNGVSAMELAPVGSLLRAKKAWVFLDDAIVFLTNGITAPTTSRVETVVNQWPLSGASTTVTREGSWLAADGVGYWFPAGGDLKVERAVRTGTWASLGASADAAPKSAEFLTLWFDHGQFPVNASAAYAIVPNMTATTMRAWAASVPVTILANNTNVSAVRDNRSGALAIVFWSAGSIEGYSSDGPAIVYVTASDKKLSVFAADPNAGNGTMRLTLPGRWRGTGATADYRSTTVEVPRNAGRTHAVNLEFLPPSRRRAAAPPPPRPRTTTQSIQQPQ